MALTLTMKVGNAIAYVHDDGLPKTAEESALRRMEIENVCAEIYWASERRRLDMERTEALSASK